MLFGSEQRDGRTSVLQCQWIVKQGGFKVVFANETEKGKIHTFYRFFESQSTLSVSFVALPLLNNANRR